MSDSDTPSAPTKKRGRPPAQNVESPNKKAKIDSAKANDDGTEKRGRGRPKGTFKKGKKKVAEKSSSAKGRGRPKKDAKGRGRPKKSANSDDAAEKSSDQGSDE